MTTIYDFPVVGVREFSKNSFVERCGPDSDRNGAITRLLCNPITGDHIAWDDASFSRVEEAIWTAAGELAKKAECR